MDMAYDALKSAPYMFQSFISLVLLAMTLIVAAGIVVSIPAYLMFAIHHMVSATKHRVVNPTRAIRRLEPVTFAFARELGGQRHGLPYGVTHCWSQLCRLFG
jgi:hypothetical protein